MGPSKEAPPGAAVREPEGERREVVKTVRLSQSVITALVRCSDMNNRSFNNMIDTILKEYLRDKNYLI